MNIDAGFVAGAFVAQITNNCARASGEYQDMDAGMEKAVCEKKDNS